MFSKNAAWVAAVTCLAAGAFAQAPAKIDFGRDVLPIFRQNCFGCHGPSQQSNGLRLDRRSSVFKAGVRRVTPGSSENSFLYHRISGPNFGTQMPPSGPLKAEQVAIIKAWIEQGADWPASLSNESEPSPLNPKAVAMVETLRSGDRAGFLKAAAEDAKLLNARGPEGSTPFMYAALYGDAALLEQLIKAGADVNARNDAKASALMWAASDLDKTRALLSHGADANAVSDDGRTALMIAAGNPGVAPIVRLLLDRGAKLNPAGASASGTSPLIQAGLAADADTMALFIERGANLRQEAAPALVMAITQGCAKCVDLLMPKELPKEALSFVMLQVANFADAKTLKALIDRGADVNAVDPFGRTALMYAAASDLLPLDVVKLLVEHGANVNAKNGHANSGDSGMTPLDIARMHGETPVSEYLAKAGGVSAVKLTAAPAAQRAASIQAAVQKALPLLQRTDAGFTAKSGCISCHNNSLGAMTVALGREIGAKVDEQTAARQVKTNVAYLEHERDALHQSYFAAQAGAEGFSDTFGPSVLAYILVGLDAEHYRADLNTDAVAIYLKNHQMPEGNWIYTPADSRQPICSANVGQTVLSMRAIQLYAPRTAKAAYDQAVQLAATWVAAQQPKVFEDRMWRLQGLAWAGRKAAAAEALRALLAEQRPDGGWSDMPTMASNAYATGRALVAAQTAGLAVTDPAYKKGVEYLLNTQIADGSWFVRTRALAIQPYFDAGFPHGVDQWISAAGTSWAAMALALAAPGAPVHSASR